MIDIDLKSNGKFDIDFEKGDIKHCYDLKTAILMSIFCEKRADISQVIQADMRRGHYTSQFTEPYEVGSLFWLYTEQTKINEANIEDIIDTILEGLQWLIDDNFLIDVDCDINYIDNKYIVNITTIDLFNNKQNYTF